MFIDVGFLNLVSPYVLSLFVVEAISSGLNVVYRVVLHAADPLPQPTIPVTEHTLRLG